LIEIKLIGNGMSSHDRMIAELAVRRTIERYCRYLDDGNHTQLLALFTEDATFSAMGRMLVGRSAIAELMGPGLTERPLRPRSAHMLSCCLVEVDGATATAETDWMLVYRTAEEGETAIKLAGRYYDKLQLINDAWLFVERAAVAMTRSKA
jgi:hypothetical protein